MNLEKPSFLLNKKALTRGQLEAEISEALTKFEKEYMGRGPLEVKTYLIDNIIMVRLKGVLTKAEYKLAQSKQTSRGRDLIKQVRIEMIEHGRDLLEASLKQITKRKVVSLHTDISTLTGERMIVFILDRPPSIGAL
ncbi:MAG: DUF2294 domain-containing protein [Chitinivibrionales bacterium]|nr:DUF2294 domain-containing protein [Chitinivibrionales bacterium]